MIKTFLRHFPRNRGFEWYCRNSDAVHAPLINEPVVEKWLTRAESQFEFLKGIGLEPHHRFLDYGCAHLATGFYVIPYLQSGNYVGIDVGRAVMARGVRRLTEAGVQRRRYHIVHAASPELEALQGFEFDVVWAYAVMHFLNRKDFTTVLRRFGEMLAPDGIICVTLTAARSSGRRALEQYEAHDYLEQLRGFRAEQHIFKRPWKQKGKQVLLFRRV